MDNFRIPPSPTWYTPAACTPDNGILYIAGNHTSIAYIPAFDSADAVNDGDPENIQIIQTHNHFKAIVCDPNWQNTKWFVTLNEHNVVWVWNLSTQKVCHGHRAHMKGTNTGGGHDSLLGGAMCITKSGQVLSIDRNAFVKYCLRSNTYKIFDDNFVLKRGTISVLKASPYDENIVALGSKNGLITIVNLKGSSVLHKLRSHDSEIVSLGWTKWKPSPAAQNNVVSCVTERLSNMKVSNPKVKTPKRETEKGREPPKAIVDAGDMFDIHSFDYLEEEFGTITESKKSRQKLDESIDEGVTDDRNAGTKNKNFDFAEACESLREQIRSNQSDTDDSETNCDTCAVNISDIKNLKLDDANDSYVCASAHDSDPEGNVSDVENLDESNAVVEPDPIEAEPNQDDASELKTEDKETIFLASGAREPFVVIWNVDTGSIHDRVQLKPQPGKSPIPTSNCVVVWIKSDAFIVNGTDGKLSLWQLDHKTSKFVKQDKQYSDVAVMSLCSNVDYVDAKPLVCSFSVYMNMVCHQFYDGMSEILANYGTLPIGMYTMRESPHDPNKIAIAGNNKRISILSLSTLNRNTVEIQSLTSRIQAKVIALAWHPINENLLCFSTNEGRVGIYNVTKSSNAPDLIRNFNGKDVYSLSFGKDPANPSKYLVYASSGNRLMIFNENSLKSDKHQFASFHAGVSYVRAMDNFVAIGLGNGEFVIFKNDNLKMEIFAEKLSTKYISEISWSEVNKLKLAVGTNENQIILFEASLGTGDEVPTFGRMGELVGHQSGITSVSWSNTSEHRLVSSSFDNTVRVWDARTMECIAWHQNENKMFCALFMPSDENYIICSGHSETLHIFDVRKRSVAVIGQLNAKKKKNPSNDIQWAVLNQSDLAKLRSQERNKLRKLEKKASSMEPTENVAAVEIAAAVMPKTTAAVQLSYTTVLYLTNKELNKEPLKHLEKMLEGPSASGENSTERFLHGKLFGTRDDVQELLMNELKNHHCSRTESIGNVLIPQMNHKLKSHIIECIEAKRLTEQQIALAPSVSYEFWKNCCLAFINQCLDKGLTFQAIPYLLAVQQSTEAIDKLCEANFYREAWCIAKTFKESEDRIFDKITIEWLKYLEQKGDLEGAALISMLAGKPQNAYDVLNKRKSKTLQIDRILEMLRTKIDSKQ